MLAEQFYYNDVQGRDQQFLFETNLFAPADFDMSPIGNVLTQNQPTQGKINITATILDEFGNPFYDANIAINDIATARANSNGVFSIKNINPFDTITVSYVGYTNQVFKANALPKQIRFPQPQGEQLQAVVITPKPKPKPALIPEKETNWYLWGGVGLLAIIAYKQFSGSSKVVKAKI